MKSIIIIALNTFIVASFAQTNSLPLTGNVGIGTGSNSADKTLTINGTIGFFRSVIGPTTTSVGYIKYENGFTFGNTSIADPIRFQTNSTDRLYIHNSGMIGIGTTDPDNTLTIDGSIGFFRNGDYPTNSSPGYIRYDDGFTFGTSSIADPLRFQTNSIDRLFIDNGGNIGIGTSNPGSFKLAVEGKIGAREFNITEANPWPDYVFEKTYNLPTLFELEAFINQNKHLPEIPNAGVVKENGINLGEMNVLMMKKIEELTLYLIEMKKENEAQQKEIDGLKKKKLHKKVPR